MLHTSSEQRVLRSANNRRKIRPAIGCRILRSLCRLRKEHIALSYGFCCLLLVGIALSYSFLSVGNGLIPLSYGVWVLAVRGTVPGKGLEKSRHTDYEQN